MVPGAKVAHSHAVFNHVDSLAVKILLKPFLQEGRTNYNSIALLNNLTVQVNVFFFVVVGVSQLVGVVLLVESPVPVINVIEKNLTKLLAVIKFVNQLGKHETLKDDDVAVVVGFLVPGSDAKSFARAMNQEPCNGLVLHELTVLLDTNPISATRNRRTRSICH
jgi:hypothetical protein